MPVIEHAGRLWRAMENADGGSEWGKRYRAMMLSVPVDKDLLKADNWTASSFINRDASWLNGKFNAWLEGNAVVTPDGHIVDILRVDNKPEGETAAIVNISDDGTTATFDARNGFIHFPGGTKKFAIRRDEKAKLYWSLSNVLAPKDVGKDPAGTRNTLALLSSPDLRDWTIKCILLHHPDREKHAFQYVDFLTDGDDLVVVSRTAFDDGLGGAHRAHDANFLTFHRFAHFRDLALKDGIQLEDR
jgi:hypothetical protein